MIAGASIASTPIAGKRAAVNTGSVNQSSRFDNINTFYAGVVVANSIITQSSRFDNTNTFYAGSVTTTRTITQSARFDNTNTFYSGVVTGGGVVAGADLLVPLLRRRRR